MTQATLVGSNLPATQDIPNGTTDEIYSFDLFDTLVTRPLALPTDLFMLIAGRAKYRSSWIRFLGFARLRRLAERIARLRSPTEDISLVGIYRILGLVVKNPAELLRREVQLELALLRPIPENITHVAALQANGKRCCVVSDMYLPPAIVRRIVRKHVGRLDCHVSSGVGLTKASGGLFEHVSRHYGIQFSQLVHTGDNPHSDQDVPEKLGAAIRPVPMRGRKGNCPSILEKLEPTTPSDDPLFRLGYYLVGPCCAAFARFIGTHLKGKPTKVAFGARDTYLIKEIFDRLYPSIQTTYFRISRRAVYLADYSVDHNPDRLFEGQIDAAQFFHRIGLPVSPELMGRTPRLNRQDFLKAARTLGLDELADAERDVLTDYFRELGFQGDVAYVDLGWRGSLQNAIQRIVGHECNLHGYYFGINTSEENKTGFYFRAKRPWMRYQRVFQAIAAFEFLFTEPGPSLKRVVRAGAGFSYEDLEDESVQQMQSRTRVADGCRRFFDDLMDVLAVAPDLDIEDRRAIDRLLETYLLRPSPETVAALRSMWHSHSFGGSHRETLCPDGKFSFQKYLDSTWRSAYVQASAPHALRPRLVHIVLRSMPGTLMMEIGRRTVHFFRRLHAMKPVPKW